MSKPDNFAAFILTNGRPHKVHTYTSLRKKGYTGKIYLLVDDLDKTQNEYKKKYGDEVIIFNKKEIAKTFDQGDNFSDMRAIIYARNACFKVAEKLKIKYFIQLDDDYQTFIWRFTKQNTYFYRVMENRLDDVFSIMLNFYKETPIHSIAMSQGGDFIGGEQSALAKKIKLKRKCMNSFLCSTERPFQFVGRINEDVNTYTHKGSTGHLFFTTNYVSLIQKNTQQSSGGMTEMYLDSGTYVKSFYSVMYQPSSVKISIMNARNKRIHHHVNWKNTTPMILREEHKKG